MIGCLWTHVRKQPIIALYFEFETVLKFYNLEAWLTLVAFDAQLCEPSSRAIALINILAAAVILTPIVIAEFKWYFLSFSFF